MKVFRSLMLVIMIAIFLTTACQRAPTTEGVPVEGEETREAEGYPYPAEGETIPLQEYPPLPEEEGGLYPDYMDGDEIVWEHAVALILNGEVDAITENQLRVVLNLKDGRTLLTTQPAVGEVLNVIRSCGVPCEEIIVTTE